MFTSPLETLIYQVVHLRIVHLQDHLFIYLFLMFGWFPEQGSNSGRIGESTEA